MKKLILFFVPVLASAAPLRDARLFNVYSIGDLRGQQSDFEGIAGAGGNIQLSNFAVAEKLENLELGGLYVGGDWQAYDGSSFGGIYVGGQKRLVRFDICCFIRRAELGFDSAAIAQSLYRDSDAYAALAPTGKARVSGRVIDIVANHRGTNVFNLSADALSRASVVKITGRAGTPVVINVMGSGSASLVAMDLENAGGLTANDVVYNFPQITQLHIERAGHARESSRPGLQGTFLAPRAATTFYSALIVGHLYVGSLDDLHGQVNVIPLAPLPPVQQEPHSQPYLPPTKVVPRQEERGKGYSSWQQR